MENAKIQKFKCDILGDFQTLCYSTESLAWLSWKLTSKYKIEYFFQEELIKMCNLVKFLFLMEWKISGQEQMHQPN